MGIILSIEWVKGWAKGGTIIWYRRILVGTTRLLSVDVAIETDDSKSDSKATKYTSSPWNQNTCTSVTSYHPHLKYKDEEAIVFNQSITEMINKIPKTNPIIIRTDINASIRVRESEKVSYYKKWLGDQWCAPISLSLASIHLAVEKNQNQFTAWRMGEISAINQCKWLPNWPNHRHIWNGWTECAWRKNVVEEKGAAMIGKRAKYMSRCKFDCLQFSEVIYNRK